MNSIKITERQLQRRVVDAAQALGWTVYHPQYSIGSTPGYPDLTLVSPAHQLVLWIELKVGTNQPTAAQVEWLRTLHMAGQHVAVIRETDHDHAVLMEILTGELRHLELVCGVYGLEQS